MEVNEIYISHTLAIRNGTIDCEQCVLFILTACIEALIENNTLGKFKQDMLQYIALYMINNTLYDIYFDMRISV